MLPEGAGFKTTLKGIPQLLNPNSSSKTVNKPGLVRRKRRDSSWKKFGGKSAFPEGNRAVRRCVRVRVCKCVCVSVCVWASVRVSECACERVCVCARM